MTQLKNISNFVGMEFATFKLKEGITEETMLQIINEVDKNFLQKKKVF